jgi:hypothetical protein
MNTPRLGFRVLGSVENRREVVDFDKALAAYASADRSVQPEIPAYLSAFSFPGAIQEHVDKTGSTAGYVGPVGVPALNFDIDAELESALSQARRLTAYLVVRYDVLPDVFFSGGKGFHLSLPLGGELASPEFANHLVAKTLATKLATDAGVSVDSGVYDKVRLWRAPNSRHNKTRFYKVKLDAESLDQTDLAEILERARAPVPFDVLAPASPCAELVADWGWALKHAPSLRKKERPTDKRRANRLTQEFLFDPTDVKRGDRHRRLFSAAADLAEFQTQEETIFGILREPGAMTGLPPKEVERQIRCGIDHVRKQHGEGGVHVQQ